MSKNFKSSWVNGAMLATFSAEDDKVLEKMFEDAISKDFTRASTIEFTRLFIDPYSDIVAGTIVVDEGLSSEKELDFEGTIKLNVVVKRNGKAVVDTYVEYYYL